MTASATVTPTEARGSAARWLLIAFFLLVALGQLLLALRRDINWDEYYFLSQIFEHQRGTLATAIQTFHVHPFSWLTGLPWADTDRIVLARLVMLGLHLATLYFLFQITRNLISFKAAVWAVVFYASLAFVAQHATSFRTDPIITALLMGALYGLSRPASGSGVLLVSAFAVGLAVLVSVKSVMYVPLLVAVALIRLRAAKDRAHLLRQMAGAAFVGLALTAVLFRWHAGGIAPHAAPTADVLRGVAGKQFSHGTLLPGLRYLVFAVLINLVQFGLLAAGVVFAIRELLRAEPSGRTRAATVLAFAAPLVFLVLYRNSYPYFYVFLMAPVALVAGYAGQMLEASSDRAKYIPLIMVFGSLLVLRPELARGQADQRSLEAAIHDIFPEPVPYLDRCSMVPSFPSAGFFMSTWGLENYRAGGRPLISRAIQERKPVFLIANHPSLRLALGGRDDADAEGLRPELEMLPEDAAALRAHFVHHWGPLWVAGTQLNPSPQDTAFDIAVPGPYTFEADASGIIGGRAASPGDVRHLDAGRHSYQGPAATLRYGAHLPRPGGPPPGPVFRGF